MLEKRNGKVFMTDVGKHVHSYGKYCTLIRKGMFNKMPLEMFVEEIETIDSIPESYAGKSRKEIVEAITAKKELVGKIIDNEILGAMTALPDRKLSELEEDLILKLKLNGLYDAERYGASRNYRLENIKGSITRARNGGSSVYESEIGLAANISRLEGELLGARRDLEVSDDAKEMREYKTGRLKCIYLNTSLRERNKKHPSALNRSLIRRLGRKLNVLAEDKYLVETQRNINSSKRTIYTLERDIVSRKNELAECDAILANLDA
jgi:hypothetical protein